jgi:hypothetical protein
MRPFNVPSSRVVAAVSTPASWMPTIAQSVRRRAAAPLTAWKRIYRT